MKRLFFYVLMIFFVSTQLMRGSVHAQAAATKVPPDSTSLSGEWWLQPVLPSDTATGHLPNINFNLAQKTFKGFTGCNQMSGNFRIRDGGISFDQNIVLTKIACEGFNEKDFIANLLRVNGYQVKDGILTLTIDKTPISKWTKKTAKQLVMK